MISGFLSYQFTQRKKKGYLSETVFLWMDPPN